MRKKKISDPYEAVRAGCEISNNNSIADGNELLKSNSQLNVTQCSANILLKSNLNIKGVVLATRQSTTMKMLNDKEKFILAKNHNYLDMLLELIHSNDQITSSGRTSSFIDFNRISTQKSNNNVSQKFTNNSNNALLSSMMSSPSQSNEMKSDLKKEWMSQENLVSHSAFNQISYLILQKRKEIKLHIYYITDQQKEKIMELIEMRKQIIKSLDEQKNLEKRLQRYLLMADDIGIQTAFYLLLLLSDDEINGPSSYDVCPEYGKASSLSSSPNVQSPEYRDQQSILTSGSKAKKFIEQPAKSKKIKKEFKTGWFKKQANSFIDHIDHVLSDSSFSRSTIRLTILFIGNIYAISSQSIKSYCKKKTTYLKLIKFFDLERVNMTEEELIELEQVLKHFYSHRELYGLTKRQKQIQRIKDAFHKDDNGQVAAVPTKQKHHQLIRTDSFESLIEAVQQDKLQNSDYYEQTGERLSERSVGIPFFQNRITDSFVPTENNHSRHFVKPSGDFNKNGDNTTKVRFQDTKRLAIDEDNYTFGQNLEVLRTVGAVHSPQSKCSIVSKDRIHLRQQNESTHQYLQTYESQTKGTPIDQTFLEMKESFVVKEKSFSMKRNGSYGDDQRFFGGHTNYQHQNNHVNHLSKITEKSYNHQTLDYEKLNITYGLSHELRQSNLNTKLGTTNGKNIEIVRSQVSMEEGQYTSCCFSFGGKKSKRNRNKKSKTDQENRIVDKSLTSSSINSFVKCMHCKNYKKCDECYGYEKQKEMTKEKLSDCAIF